MANRATAYSVKQTAMPGQTRCQNRRSRALGLLLLNPRWGKQNNLTHPKWLFTWPRRWMSTFDSRVKQSAWAPMGALACWMILYSLLLPFHRSLKLFHCLSPGPKPKKETDKTNLWQECCGAVRCQCLRWVETPVYTFDMICLNSLNERGHFTGIFLGPFQGDKCSGSVKFSSWSNNCITN